LVSLDFVKKVGEEADMPFAVGGGIRSIQHIHDILEAGAEKVIINTCSAEDPDFILRASESFGSSAITVCMDVKKKRFGRNETWINGGRKPTGFEPLNFARLMEEKGAGELVIQSIAKDGMRTGYDVQLVRAISEAVTIPVIALGGAGNLEDLKRAYYEGYANGLGAGSMFVYYGKGDGVLINYPKKEDFFY
jgi:cyclase